MEMDTKGNVHLAKNPMASKEIAIRVPLKAESVLDYEERLLAIDKTADATSASQRYYHDAQSTSTLNGKETTSRLRKIARTTIVRQGSRTEQTGAGEMAGSRAMEYSVQDYFRQDELDLLYVPVCSLAVDSVLPESPIAKGQVVKVNEDAIARMMNVGGVQDSDVTIELFDIDDSSAKLKLDGTLSASVNGVLTKIELKGKLTFDRKLKTCTWCAIAMRERREIGIGEPGFEVAATVRMIRKPLKTPQRLPKELDAGAAQKLLANRIPSENLLVDIQSQPMRFGVLADRRWRIVHDVHGNTMIRMVDNDRSIAQVELKPLQALKAGKQLTLEGFKRDIQQSMGSRIRDVVTGEQTVNSAGLRVLRVVVSGMVQDIAMQWIYAHISD
ncbi:MAG: hypothetical protein AAFP90_17375, partial [Planctomycetota bacterium]